MGTACIDCGQDVCHGVGTPPNIPLPGDIFCVRPQLRCDPSNCAGCCTIGAPPPDAAPGPGPEWFGCVDTPADHLCGSGGGACSACGSNEHCAALSSGGGVCQVNPPCGPDNGAGCCYGNVCAVGDQDIACGTGGGPCIVCDGGHCAAGGCY